MKNLFYFSLMLIIGCSDSRQHRKHIKTSPVQLENKLFSFGPRLDSTNVEVLAECDCCGSDILFNKDSTFIAAFYCLEGDSYAKGIFEVTDKEVTLTYAPMEVTKLYDMDAEYDSTTYQKTSTFQVVKQQLPKSTINISFLKSQLVLTTSGEEKDYGVESKELTRSSFINRLRKDSVSYYLKIE